MKSGRLLTALWYGRDRSRWHPLSWLRGLVGVALSPLSLVFRILVAVRRRRIFGKLGRMERIPVPVVIVGNLTVGGAGKTPLVIALVEALRRAGRTPGVISRGHGGRVARDAKAVTAVDPAEEDAADRFGDEPVLIASRTGAPVFVGRDRPGAARALLDAHPDIDVLLSDDGLQHYALARNFEIAVFDERGIGNGRMLPAGPLREPLSRLADLDAIVLNGPAPTAKPARASKFAKPPQSTPKWLARRKTIRPPFRMDLVPGDAYRVNDRSVVRPLDSFRGRRLTAAAGIGNPQRFFATLRGAGLSFHRMPLADHHRYRENPFEWRNSEAVLMTEKDAVKCARFDEKRMWAVPVTAQIDAGLVEAILGHIGGGKPLAAAPSAALSAAPSTVST